MEASTSGRELAETAAVPAQAAVATALTGPAVARALGVTMAAPALALDALVGQLAAGQPLSGTQLAALRGLSAQFEAIRTQGQQLARLAGEPIQARPERIALQAAVVDILLRRGAPWHPKVSDLHQRLEAVDVMADAGLLSILLEAAFTWTGGLGESLTVRLETTKWPRHALLTARAVGRPRVAASKADLQSDNLSWLLLAQAARAAGAVLQRHLTSEHAYLTLEFTATLPPEGGLSLLDADPAGAQDWRLDSRSHAGRSEHIVLITEDLPTQRQVRQACQRLGLGVRAFTSIQEAAVEASATPPAALIIDGLLNDVAFGLLRARLAARGHEVPAIEIGDSQSGFEVASWEARSLSRITRDMLETQLESVLSLELGR
jgi:hypothetical protein